MRQLTLDYDKIDPEGTIIDQPGPVHDILNLIGVPEYGSRGRGLIVLEWVYDGDSILRLRVYE